MIGLLIFALCVLLLVGGYFLYGKLAERLYGVDVNMTMPCQAQADGVDYVAMPAWRVFMIQLLNIAGLGPVFGAVAGCLFGPVCLLWIVLGCILAGAVHDFYAAVASAEQGGANLPGLIGKYLGRPANVLMNVVCLLLMFVVGVVFTVGPADMLHAQIGSISAIHWCAIIILYYFLATILPINVIIGKIYPFFGALFLFMALGLAVQLPLSGYEICPQRDFFANMHPTAVSVWPALCITIACGAISGFHATQSPMMVRCLARGGQMRSVFYGAMVTEGLVALVWALAGLTFREVLDLENLKPAVAVSAICAELLGPIGAVVAVLGVVVLPITSGDTAMRCCRLMLADVLKLKQVKLLNRCALAIPIFVLVIIVSCMDFNVIWRYFGWLNQVLACITLWALAVLMKRRGRFHWVVSMPAFFLTNVCVCFMLISPDFYIGVSLSAANIISLVVTSVLYGFFLLNVAPRAEKQGV